MHGEMTQVTFGPVHMGGSAFAGKITQRHEPHELSNILQSVFAAQIALAHERVGNADTARDFYERIFSLDINFKDVVERLKSLR